MNANIMKTQIFYLIKNDFTVNATKGHFNV